LTRFRYQEGYLFCCHCDKQYKIEECPYVESKTHRYRTCPECPYKLKLRTKPHNKNSTKYYYEVIKPQLQKDRETIVKWKQKRYSDSPQQQQQQQQQEKDKNTK
jgi:hypothetical protein